MITIPKKLQLLSMAAALALTAASAAHAAPTYQTTRTTTTVTKPATGSYVNDPAVPVWAGPYMGVHIGGVWSDFTNAAPTAGPSGGSSSPLAGAQVGWNWQANKIVYGVEADWSWLDLGSRNGGARFKEDWTATARGRLGYAIGPWLPFISGGVAFTQTHREFGASSSDNIQAGYAAGAGVEKFISPNWSARLEYLYTDVSKSSESVGGTPVEGGSSNSAARLAFNYHF